VRLSRTGLLLWLVVALLLLLAWLTATGRLGRSRHGYAADTKVTDRQPC
jgi:hypothetical protein